MELSYIAVIFTLVWSSCHSAAVVYNTTEDRLYTDLFTNYKSHLRPVQDYNYYSPVTVNLQFGLTLIESLNEKQQKMTSYGYIAINWADQFLKWNPQEYSSIFTLIVPAEKVWLPYLKLVNSATGANEIDASAASLVTIYTNGIVVWGPFMKWETMCEVSVQDFPYDTQICRIMYMNVVHATTVVNFTVNTVVNTDGIILMPEWELTKTSASFEHQSNGQGGYYPRLQLEVTLRRDATFFELNVVLPAILLSVLMIPMFMLPVESGEKTSLGVTIMLAYSIFLLMMSDVIPRSGTLPRLTLLILVCICFSGIAVFLNVMIINLHHHSPEKPVPKWLKVLVLQKLSKILCCMSYEDGNDVQPFSDNVGKKTSHAAAAGKQMTKDMIGNDFSSGVGEIIEYLEFFKSAKLGDDVIEQNKDDWNKVARVIDRLLMCVYTVFVVSSVISVLALKYSR